MIEQRTPSVSGEVIEADGGLLTDEERAYVTPRGGGLQIRSDLPFEIWERLVGRLVAAEKRVLWYLGDLLNFGEHRYGEKYAQAVEATGYTAQALMDACWVASRFTISRRRENLSIHDH